MKQILIQAGKGVASGYTLTIVKVFQKLIIVPMLISFVGNSLYGIWLIIGEVTGYLKQTEGGMSFAVEQRVASIKWKNNLTDLNTIFSCGILIFLISGFLGIVAGFCLSPFFVEIFKVEAEYHSLVTIVFVLTVVSMGIGMPLGVISSFLRGVQKQSWAINISIINLIVGFILVLLLLYSGLGLLALPISGLILLLFRYSLSLYLLKQAEKNISFSIKYVKKKVLVNLISFSFFAFINRLSNRVIFATDSILIGIYLGSSQVTIYMVTFQLTLTLIGFAQNISDQLRPGYAEISYMKDSVQLKNLFMGVFRVVMVFSGLAGAAVYLMNCSFVELWVGKENFGGQTLTSIFALVGIYFIFRHAMNSFFISCGEIRFVSRWVSFEALLNLSLSLILIQMLGIIGPALGTLFAGIIASCLILLPRFVKKFELSLINVISLLIFRPVIFSVPAALTFWAFNRYIFHSLSWYSFIITATAGSCISAFSIWYNTDIRLRTAIFTR